MTLTNMIQMARRQLGELTGLAVASTISVRKDGAGWRVQAEVVEKKSLFDGQDILAAYELAVDGEGNVVNFTRIGMRRRMDVAAAAAESGA